MSLASSELDEHQTAASQSDIKMTELLGQSHEVLHEIFSYLHAQDLANLSKSCAFFADYIRHNTPLWKDVYLLHHDEPRPADYQHFEWEQFAQDIVKFTKLCHHSVPLKVKKDPANLEFAARTIIKLAHHAQPDSVEDLDHVVHKNRLLLLNNLEPHGNLEPFIQGSNLYNVANSRPESTSKELSQLLAKVHCLHGVQDDKYCDHRSMVERITRQRASTPFQPDSYARSRVYDLRYYNENNKWGPWSDDGQMWVDWETVECIMLDLGYNAAMFTAKICRVLQHLWRQPFQGVQPNSYVDRHPPDKSNPNQSEAGPEASSAQAAETYSDLDGPSPAELAAALNAKDPFGVAGTWQRIVCFLDYSDFYFLNFHRSPPLGERRPPIDHEEAIRLILMEISVTEIEQIEGCELPRVHFRGYSRSMHAGWDPNASSTLTGFVELTPEKEVRWSTLSHVQGEERWRSEGVQVGGIRSERGVIGTWFDKDHDRNGPCGPTAFWKITDSIGNLASRRHGVGSIHMFDPYNYALNSDDEDEDDEEFEPGSEQSDDMDDLEAVTDEEDDDEEGGAGSANVDSDGHAEVIYVDVSRLQEYTHIDVIPVEDDEEGAIAAAPVVHENDS